MRWCQTRSRPRRTSSSWTMVACAAPVCLAAPRTQQPRRRRVRSARGGLTRSTHPGSPRRSGARTYPAHQDRQEIRRRDPGDDWAGPPPPPPPRLPSIPQFATYSPELQNAVCRAESRLDLSRDRAWTEDCECAFPGAQADPAPVAFTFNTGLQLLHSR